MAPDLLVDRTAEDLLENVERLVRRLRQRPAGGLNQTERAVLGHLAGRPQLTVADLARAEGVRPQSMGAVVGSLEAQGLVKRHQDRVDARRVLLTVTRAGRAAAGQRQTGQVEQLAAGLSSGFTRRELEQLMAAAPLLGRLAGRLS